MASAALRPGGRLGRYELIRLLAVGGMAEIHLARIAGIEGFTKLVVIKRILPELAEDAELVRLFLAEGRLAAKLHHPNITEVFDVDVADGSYFIAMEYVRGENLARVIAAAIQSKRGLSLACALTVIAGVAEGLHHAHEQRDGEGQPLGIVHRDVSPSNVLLSYDGRVQVCDFGIAKVAARKDHTTGVPRGKLSYMSPEQVRGEPVDRRCDVFAIGIMLYELTTGRRLFRGNTDHEIATLICDRDVPAPTSVRPSYSPALERIVMRSLRRDPAERYATAQELQIDIEEFARSEQLVLSSVALARYLRELLGEPAPEQLAAPVEPPTTKARPRRRWWLPISAAVVGSAAVAAVVAAQDSKPARPAEPAAPPAVVVSPDAGAQPIVEAAAQEQPASAPQANVPPRTKPRPPARRPPVPVVNPTTTADAGVAATPDPKPTRPPLQ